jgi:hypothetical protein
MLVSASFIAGCSTTYKPPPSPPGTPSGSTAITITATSGAIVQSTTVTLNVQ